MRRWLKLGAASACMGAALIGWSLVGSEVGVASADSGVGSSSSPGTAAAPAKGAGARPPASRKAHRALAANHADPRSRIESHSNRIAAAGNTAAANRLSTPTSKPSNAAQTTFTPPGVLAGKGDPLGTLGNFFANALKQLLGSKTLLNPVQRTDDLNPARSIYDLIPKIPVQKHDTTWYREAQIKEAENRQRDEANKRQIADILQKGVKLTGRDGMAVYSIDGKTFVKYTRVFAYQPPEPAIVRLSSQNSAGNTDRIIRNVLKLDPAQVRNVWK